MTIIHDEVLLNLQHICELHAQDQTTVGVKNRTSAYPLLLAIAMPITKTWFLVAKNICDRFSNTKKPFVESVVAKIFYNWRRTVVSFPTAPQS